MALQVLIAHTGQRLEAKPGSFATLDTFKAWVAKNGGITVPNQITLTAAGKAVRVQTINSEQQEIFVYDRHAISASSAKSTRTNASHIPIPPKYEAESTPVDISDEKDLQAWRNLFMARRTWALKLVDDCAKMSDSTQMRYAEMDVITRSIGAAVLNLQTHVSSLDRRLAEAQSWAAELSKNHQDLVNDWEGVLARLQSLPASTAMVRFIVERDPRRGKQKACLEDLVEPDKVKEAGEIAQNALKLFNRNLTELGQIVDRVMSGTDNLTEKTEKNAAKSALERSGESIQLMEDIEAIAKKVNTDYESVLGFANVQKSVPQASKLALLHTRTFCPNLRKRSLEMDGIFEYATEMRNSAAIDLVESMQAIGALNTMCTDIVTRLDALGMADEDHHAFELLQVVDRLPAIYASFLVEAIRRREWNEKVKSDSSTLANEMATFQDEEERRRKKWQKTTGSIFLTDRTEFKALGLEVNLLGDEDQWPLASRQDLDGLLESLRTQSFNFKAEVITEVTQIIADLNNPTKQQTKRAKAFKNGSFHEAALGRSTLLMRGDDDLIRTLQDEKIRIESKLRGSESRVRRLEDLLHRQSQMSRVSTANMFQPSSPDIRDNMNPLSSPRLNEDSSRRSSMSSRRVSANNGPEEKAYAQKLISLEAELIAERERSASLEKEVSARANSTNEIKTQIQDANSTKVDLLNNLEAQKNEFDIERKSLEDEIKDLKSKIEACEDDMDRIIGSRENEKASIDERVRSLLMEVEKLRLDGAAQKQKAEGQVDFLRNDAKLQRESNDGLMKDLQRARDDMTDLKSRAERAEVSSADHLRSLHGLHKLLIPAGNLPSDFFELSEGLFSTSRDVVAELDVHKRELSIAHSDRDEAQTILRETRTQLTEVTDKLKTEEMETFQLREELAAERAKYQALEAEMKDEREQLVILRAKFADGETGSEALRSRVEEEERKVTTLSEELASTRSHVGSLEEELHSIQDRLESSQEKLGALAQRFEARTARAKDLTQRAYAQNDRLCRLLERMSYSVVREGDSMVIQRVPRSERASANESSDPGSSMRQSELTVEPRKATMADSGDLDLLQWMNSEDTEAESEKYTAYLNAIGNFDVEAFCETILKRIKDAEHAARRYTKDARAYREKYQRAQKEAHEKIAFKNFKEGDLGLFLPTKNQVTGAWAAFNVGAPHYFLHEQDSHKLQSRDWLLARIHKIEPRVVDLSKSMRSTAGDRGSIDEGDESEMDDDNPFGLSDGLRWYLIDASEERPGAPSTPGLGQSTVATTSIDATGSIRRTQHSSSSGVEGVSKTLTRSLDSRRSSSNSKKAAHGPSALNTPAKAPASLSDASKPSALPQGESSMDASNRLEVPSGTQTPPQLVAGSSNLEAPTTNNINTPSGTSPSKKSVIWDSLWSLDLSLEHGKGGARGR